MNLTEKTEQEHAGLRDNSDSKKKPRRRGCLRICFWAFLVFALVFAVCAFYLHAKITEPIDVKNASTVQAVGWLTMRDLSQESAETREDLFQLYVGSATVPDVDNESGKQLKLPENVKKLTSVFLKDRDKQIEAWSQTNERAPYLRLDYLIVPNQTESRTSQYVVSADVQPGPSLKERWTLRREASESDDAPKRSYIEKNVQLLVMQWFVARMNEYDSTSDEQKRQKLESISDELMHMQGFYNQLRGTEKSLSRVQLLREFEATTESWNEIATVDELAKTLWFKDLLVSVTASKMSGIHTDFAPYPPLLPEKYRETSETKKETAPGKNVCDAIRNYFFDGAR